MRIEVQGPFNEGGSSWPVWIYEIDATCDRILVDPYRERSYGRGKVWGFKDGEQIEGELVSYESAAVVIG